jgi:mannose-1-phosphate guanylyltransferase
MRAVVLVGGFGTRLRPLTSSIPKPMLPVGHLPIIERLVANLGRGGVTEVTLALGFKPEPFVQAFPDGTCAGVALRYAVEPEPLDTAGAIRFAAEAAGIDDTFVVANGDVLTDVDVAALVAFHRAHAAEATIHLTPVPDPSAFGVVALDADGKVERFIEKPAPGTAPTNLINAGTYVLEPSVIGRIAAGQKVSIERVTFPAIVADGGLYALATDDYWLDAGRPELYLQANLDIVDGLRRHDHCEPIHADAEVSTDAHVRRSIIGAGARVGSGVTIDDSVVLSGAVIDAGAVVIDSVVMGRVGARAEIRGVVLGADAVVADDEQVRNERRPDPDAP